MWHPLTHGRLPSKFFIFKSTELFRNKQFKGTEIIIMQTWPLKPYIKIYFTSYWKGIFYMDTCTGTWDQIYYSVEFFFHLVQPCKQKNSGILHTIIIFFHVSILRFFFIFPFLVQSSASSKSSGNTTWLQMWKIPWVYYFFFIL